MPKKQGSNQSANIDRETWHQILKAAEELFLTKGYRGVSMKDVAEAVQVTPAALYYHFPQGKEDLFLSVIQAMFEDLDAGIGQAILPANNFRERLYLLTTYLLTLPVDQFPVLMRDAREQIKDHERQHAIFKQMRGTVHQHIVEIFQQAVDVHEIEADCSANALATMYQGMVFALLQQIHFPFKNTGKVDAPRLASSLVSALLDGIACPALLNNN